MFSGAVALSGGFQLSVLVCFVFWLVSGVAGDGAIVMVSLFVYVQYACLW